MRIMEIIVNEKAGLLPAFFLTYQIHYYLDGV